MTAPQSETRGILFGRSHLARWVVSGIVTIASTYVLDLIATASGLVVLTSGMLSRLDLAYVGLVLAATYVVWALALRVNLEANWRLLEQTGTSSNVFSKAAYDLVRARTTGRRLRRFAADVGYVMFELAKEVPYYLGAFGAAFATDAISSKHALIFLAGANLGAAVYEYGLARLVRTLFLDRKEPVYASFERDWVPREYLRDYYCHVEPDEKATIEFFVNAMKEIDGDQPVLLFGVGPTLHHVFLTACRASEIHLGDYLRCNLDEIERWLAGNRSAHDWDPFVRYTLGCEGIPDPSPADVDERERLVRRKVTRLLEADFRKEKPIEGGFSEGYGTVICAYCVDSATASKADWSTYMERIIGLVRPGGSFLTAALCRSNGYHVGGKTFPSPFIEEDDLCQMLVRHFAAGQVTVRSVDLKGTTRKGYPGIVLGSAHGRRCGVPAGTSA